MDKGARVIGNVNYNFKYGVVVSKPTKSGFMKVQFEGVKDISVVHKSELSVNNE